MAEKNSKDNLMKTNVDNDNDIEELNERMKSLSIVKPLCTLFYFAVALLIFILFGIFISKCTFYTDREQPQQNSIKKTIIIGRIKHGSV